MHDDWSNGQSGVRWSRSCKRVALNLFSYDNKDRWLVELALNNIELKTVHRLTDNAWVNDSEFNEFGWFPDEQSL